MTINFILALTLMLLWMNAYFVQKGKADELEKTLKKEHQSCIDGLEKFFESEDEPKTNRDYLESLSDEEFAEMVVIHLPEYGRGFTDSRLAIIEWLKAEREEVK
jgi:hypothetical protein